MLAWGWRVARTREGDSMALYSRTRRISQTSQVGPAQPPAPLQTLSIFHFILSLSKANKQKFLKVKRV